MLYVALWSVALVGTLSTPISLAHEPESDHTRLSDIVVIGRGRNLVGLAVSAAEGRVGQPEIERRPILRTGEIFELIPGMVVTQHSGTGKGNQMFLRGFNLDHGTDFATWVDGMPVNLRTHAHGQGYTDINFLIPELVEEMEYRKGPYYADVGDFSSAGSVNINTFRSLDDGMLKAGTGEDGFRRVLAADSFEVGAGKFMAAGEVHYYDGPWDDIDEDLDKYNGLLRYSQSGGWGDLDLTFMGYDAEWNSADQIPERAVQQGLISRRGSLDEHVGGDTHRYSLSASWIGESRFGQTLVSAYGIDYKLKLYSNFTYFLDDPVNGDEFEQSEDRRIYGGRVEQHWDQPGNVDMAHRVGLELRYDDIDDVGLYQTAARQRLNTFRQDDVEESSAGLYYINDLQWTHAFRSVLGLRADWYDYDVDSSLPENSGDDDDFLFSPKLNLIYGLRPDLELYASAGKGFHSNDARGTTISVDPRTGDPVDPVDPLVESTGAELGVRFGQPALNASMSLWYLELDSELLYVGDAGTTEASDKSERAGVEFAGYWRPRDWLTLDLDYSYADAELKGNPDGDEIPGAIGTVVAAGAAADFPYGFFGSVRLRYFGDYPLVEDNSVESDSFTTVNMQLGWDLGPWRAQLDVLNLFDSDDNDIEYFYASRLPGEPAEGVEDRHFHPIEPRTLRFYLTYTFGRGRGSDQ
jgi:outer membrane receptor protein involved in Fe transport